MTNWSAGYVADIGYTYGYYGELNPQRLRLPLLNSGLVIPQVRTACELGFGQGLSVNVHAASSDVEWHGTDFNPSQAGFAQELSRISGSNSHLHDQGFHEFCARQDLPDFDYIGLHGIWSWISDENRRVIVDFVSRKLKVGGVLYISYNTLPGWEGFAPVRHLMTEHVEAFGERGKGVASRIDAAIAFTDALLATNPRFSRINPSANERFNKMKEHSRNYLAHEYFNRDWHPMYFSDMAKWLEDSKLQYACSSNLLDHIDTLNLTPEHQELIKTIPDPAFRETTRDFMVNQQFRRDYWIKGPRRLAPTEQAAQLSQEVVMLTSHRADVGLKITGAAGDANMSPEVYNPILDFLADHSARKIGEIAHALGVGGADVRKVVQAVLILIGAGHISPVNNDIKAISTARKTTNRLNSHLCNKAHFTNDVGYLASPVTGGGVIVNRFQQLFLVSISQGKKDPQEWAQYVWQTIATQGHRLLKDGKTLESPEENLAELGAQAVVFAKKQLPILKALQII